MNKMRPRNLLLKALAMMLVVFVLNIGRILLQAASSNAKGLSLSNIDAIISIAAYDTVRFLLLTGPVALIGYIIWVNVIRQRHEG